MNQEKHYRRLEAMYLSAPLNDFYKPKMTVSEARAEIAIELNENFHHAARAVHGSVYFKMMDDSAWFACNSLEPEFFVLTTSFTTYITRPVSEGTMRAVGTVVNQNKTQFVAESVVYDSDDREIARGNGLFVRGKHRLVDAMGYADE